MMTRLLLALLLGVATYCVLPNEISAEESENAVSQNSEVKEFSLGTKPNGRPDLTKTARNAGIFLIVASLISYFIKRKKNLFSPSKKTENKLHLVEQLSIGNNSALLLVNAMGVNLLLGKHQGKIEFLTSLSPDGNKESGYKSPSELPAGTQLETLSERVQSIRVASLNAN
jgi:flagellar biogenesis protein FliO